MDRNLVKFLGYNLVFATILYVAGALFNGGYADASVWLSPLPFMLLALILFLGINGNTATIHARLHPQSRLALLNYGLRVGLFFASFLLLTQMARGPVGGVDRVASLVGGVVFASFSLIFLRRSGDQKIHPLSMKIYDLDNPFTESTFGAVVYYGLPLLALFAIIIGPVPSIYDDEMAWMRSIIFMGGITYYYHFNRKLVGKGVLPNILLGLLPIFPALFLIASKYL